MNIPVLFCVFNRPHHTELTLKALKDNNVKHLYVCFDGPRKDNPIDIENCRRVKELIDNIDWDCTVRCNISPVNLGLKKRIVSGLNWFFGHVDKGIILEDDCLPNKDFFKFVSKMLKLYEHNEAIGSISGNYFGQDMENKNFSYSYSKYFHCWGWATWKNRWLGYRSDITFWPEYKLSQEFRGSFDDRVELKHWTKIFDNVFEGKLNTWAYPWMLNQWFYNLLTVVPSVNLVSNIGFDSSGTNIKYSDGELSKYPTSELKEIKSPPTVRQDKILDQSTFNDTLGGKFLKFPNNVLNFIPRVFRAIIRRVKRFTNEKRN